MESRRSDADRERVIKLKSYERDSGGGSEKN